MGYRILNIENSLLFVYKMSITHGYFWMKYYYSAFVPNVPGLIGSGN